MVLAGHQVSAANAFPVPYVVTQDTGDGNLTEKDNTYFAVDSRLLITREVNIY